MAMAASVMTGSVAAQSIFTVAGGGTDDGRPATVASVGAPRMIAVDDDGNLFVASSLTNRIRRIDANTGILTTVAGTGSRGFGGDGGPATVASLYYPWGVVVDADGSLLITDSENHRIRRVDGKSGIITTLAGTGDRGYGGDGGPASSAFLAHPRSLALDPSGRILIADQFNQRIRRIDAESGVITTVAGRGTVGFSGDGGPATEASLGNPHGVAVDRQGNILIADTTNHRVRHVASGSGVITTIAGNGSEGYGGDGGPAVDASLDEPAGVSVDEAGNVFIADTGNQRVRRVDAVTGAITTIAGDGDAGFGGDGGPARLASLNRPQAVLPMADGTAYVADGSNQRVRHIDTAGFITTIAGNGDPTFGGDGGAATRANLDEARAITFDPAGNLYVADSISERVRRIDAASGIITTAASVSLLGTFILASDVLVDDAFGLYIADAFFHKIRRVDLKNSTITTIAGSGSKGFAGDGGPATETSLNGPQGIALDGSGNVLVADTDNDRIRRIDRASGTITTIAGTGSRGYGGDGGPSTAALLSRPLRVDVDEGGDIFIADTLNFRVRQIDATTGLISTVAGNGEGTTTGDGGPATSASIAALDIAFDVEGNLHVSGLGRVRRIDSATGIITTVAGTGTIGSSGDGGAATEASIAGPYGITFDAGGNLFIADTDSGRVRVVYRCVDVRVPALQTPTAGSSGVRTSPTLSWAPVEGAFRYDVYLDTANPPQRLAKADVETAALAPAGLDPLTTYYWKVVAKGDPFCTPIATAESQVWSFTTTSSCDVPLLSGTGKQPGSSRR
jgi:sugar lactone lactonase YvrE